MAEQANGIARSLEPNRRTRGPRSRRVRQLRRNLRASRIDGAFYGVTIGLGETYLPLFVLTVGLSEVMSGLVVSVPVLIGGALQMISPWAVRGLRSHGRWVICVALFQAVSFLPLIAAAFFGHISGWAAMAVASLYWSGNLAAGAAWNVWIGTLIPRPIRAHFFAKRVRLQQLTVLTGFLAGGFALQFGNQHDCVLLVFAVLFTIASVCRFVSAGLLSLQSEPQPLPANMRQLPVFEQLRQYRSSPGGRLLLYIILVQFGVWISGPYFTPYMRQKLGLSYSEYAVLIAFSFVSKIVALPMCGRLAKRFGARRLLTLGGLGIVPMSAMWTVSDNYAWLCFTQISAGIVWAAYELAFFLLFFDSIPVAERVSVLTFFNLLNSAALAAGAMLGGALLHFGGETRWVYSSLFVASSVWRLFALLFLARVPAISVPVDAVGMEIEELRSTGETLDGPIVSSLPDEAGARRVNDTQLTTDH